jgi:hypothetical protein
MDITHQNEERIVTLNKDSSLESFNQNQSNNLNSQSILPRQGWQDKQAFAIAVIKAKIALDIAEVSNLISFLEHCTLKDNSSQS